MVDVPSKSKNISSERKITSNKTSNLNDYSLGEFSSMKSPAGNTYRTPQPEVVEGFEHVKRYWDEINQCWSAKILPGEIYVSRHGEMITTVLGSCISVCVRDVRLGIGGMNHFMLPDQGNNTNNRWGTNPTTFESRYGNWAMEYLINAILKMGSKREHLELKVFGGGKIIPSLTDIGQHNILFLKQYIRDESLNVVASDLGDTCSRKILFFTKTGAVHLKRMHGEKVKEVANEEKLYQQLLFSKKQKDRGGDIDLF